MRLLTSLLMLLLCAAAHSADIPDSGSANTATVSNPQFYIKEVDDAWRANLPRAADAATQAYMERLPAEVVARSNAYFEGGYWLLLWNFLLSLTITIVLLSGKRSARIRDWALRIGRYAFIRDALYGAVYSLCIWVLSLPLAIYEGYVREHAYGMGTQSFGSWFIDNLKSLGIETVMLAIAIAILYAAIRRVGERWWLWGTGLATVFITFSYLVWPIWIDPLFNTYKPLDEGQVRTSVLAMAKANEVPVTNVYWYDASRQTTQVSANVSGIFGSAAIRLNDNLLLRSSLPEIRAVTGHEIGHYVLHHIYIGILEFAVIIMIGFSLAKWAMNRLLRRYSSQLGLQGVADVASLPLLVAVFSVYMFFMTPIDNTLTRVEEIEADRFGFNLAREPLGAAEAYLKLTEYRKPDPGPVEEFIFFDHPSTRFRIHAAMQWRENMQSQQSQH